MTVSYSVIRGTARAMARFHAICDAVNASLMSPEQIKAEGQRTFKDLRREAKIYGNVEAMRKAYIRAYKSEYVASVAGK